MHYATTRRPVLVSSFTPYYQRCRLQPEKLGSRRVLLASLPNRSRSTCIITRTEAAKLSRHPQRKTQKSPTVHDNMRGCNRNVRFPGLIADGRALCAARGFR
eukprot:6198866-Pleurochrysis_carterae.AAC.1